MTAIARCLPLVDPDPAQEYLVWMAGDQKSIVGIRKQSNSVIRQAGRELGIDGRLLPSLFLKEGW